MRTEGHDTRQARPPRDGRRALARAAAAGRCATVRPPARVCGGDEPACGAGKGNAMDPYNSADAPAVRPAVPPVPPRQGDNPYAAPRAQVRDPEAVGAIELASRLARLGAVLVDSALFAVPAIVAAIAVPALPRASDGTTGAAANAILAAFALAMVGLAIYQFVLLYRNGQTIGKRMLGVRIARPDGSRVGFGRLLALRYVVPGLFGAIPVLGPFFSIVDALFIFAEDRRTLHDRIANTIVVKT